MANQESLEMTTTQGRGLNENTAISREVASIQGAIFMARQFPRDEQAAKNRIIKACKRPTLAMAAIYKYAKGGTNIEGPSIRLAEVLAQSWGNIDYGILELEQSNGESIVQAYAWDLETNTRQTKRFTVPHIRHTKKGDYTITDPREIYELVANNGARRVRACILGIIPGDIAESAVEACKNTQNSVIEVTPETIEKLVKAFSEYGVTLAMLEAKVMRKITSIDAYLINELRNVYTSLKDNMGTVEDYFDINAKSSQSGLGDTDKPKESGKKQEQPSKSEVTTEAKDDDKENDPGNLFPQEDVDF